MHGVQSSGQASKTRLNGPNEQLNLAFVLLLLTCLVRKVRAAKTMFLVTALICDRFLTLVTRRSLENGMLLFDVPFLKGVRCQEMTLMEPFYEEFVHHGR